MAHQVRVATVGSLVILLTLVLSAGLVSAEPERSGSGKVNVSPKERAEFVKGAKKVGGLSDRQIKKALKDPELFRAVPVKVQTSSKVLGSGQSDSQQPAANSITAQKHGTPSVRNPLTHRKRFTYEITNLDGEPFLKFIATKTWRYNGTRVLSGSMNEVETWVKPELRGGPNREGWVYVPSSENGTEQFVNFEGRKNGGHKSTRAGKFEYRSPWFAGAWAVQKVGIIQTGLYHGACASRYYTPKSARIDSGPSGLRASKSARFTFSSAPKSTFKCNIDGKGFSNCTSPKLYTSLSEGSHSFRLKAADARGNAAVSPSARKWTVDTIRPRIVRLAPLGGKRGVSPKANLEVTFSEKMKARTFNRNTFNLKKRRTGETVKATLRYNATTRKVTLNPRDNLERGVAYQATLKGGKRGVKDLAGNPLAKTKAWSFAISKAPVR